MYVSYRNNAPPKGVQRIAAIDIATGRLVSNHEPFYDIWTERARRPVSQGNPVTLLTSDQQHVFYRDRKGEIQHIFVDGKNHLFSDSWTERAKAIKAAGDPVTMLTDNQQHIFYRDHHGDIQHLFVNDRNQIFHDVWTQRARAAKSIGEPATMVTSGQQHIFYRDGNGEIQHIFVNAQNQIFHDVWTERARKQNSDTVRAAGDPVTMVTADQQHIFYRDINGDIQHIFVNAGNQIFHDIWTQRARTQNADVLKAAGDPVVMMTAGQQHIFYRDINGDIQHIFVNDRNQMFQDIWTRRAKSLRAVGDPVTMLTDGQQHIFYRDVQGDIQHIFVNDQNQFFSDIWTRRGGAPASIGNPATLVTAHQQHLFYRSGNGEINHIFFDDASFQDHDVSGNPIWNQLHRSRASLLLDHGLVYVGFGALCESDSDEATNADKHGIYGRKTYQGWIYAFDAHTLAFAGRFQSVQSPVGPHVDPSDEPIGGGGIWQASTGLTADYSGNLLFATGNQWKGNHKELSRPDDPLGKNLSSSVVRLKVTREPGPETKVTLTASDWFTPYRKVWQDQNDMDLGSGGVVRIPHSPYLIAGGKEGVIYLLDQGNLGKFDDSRPFTASQVMSQGLNSNQRPDDSHRDHVTQKFLAATNEYCLQETKNKETYCAAKEVVKGDFVLNGGVSMDHWAPSPHIHGTPVFGDFGNGHSFFYIWPEKDYLKAFKWSGTRFDTSPLVNSSVLTPPFLDGKFPIYGMPGGMLALSIDPSQPDSGVLFASVQRCRASLTDPGTDCSIDRARTQAVVLNKDLAC